MLFRSDPHLLAVDDVTVTLAHGKGFEFRCICASRRLGDGEGLQPKFAGGDLRQIALLLRFRADLEDQRAALTVGDEEAPRRRVARGAGVCLGRGAALGVGVVLRQRDGERGRVPAAIHGQAQ